MILLGCHHYQCTEPQRLEHLPERTMRDLQAIANYLVIKRENTGAHTYLQMFAVFIDNCFFLSSFLSHHHLLLHTSLPSLLSTLMPYILPHSTPTSSLHYHSSLNHSLITPSPTLHSISPHHSITPALHHPPLLTPSSLLTPLPSSLHHPPSSLHHPPLLTSSPSLLTPSPTPHSILPSSSCPLPHTLHPPLPPHCTDITGVYAQIRSNQLGRSLSSLKEPGQGGSQLSATTVSIAGLNMSSSILFDVLISLGTSKGILCL